MEKLSAAKFHLEPPFTSLDHLVGEDVELRRYGHSERVGGFAIDHQIEPCRLLHRQISGFCPFENLVNERSGAAEELREVLAIAHQPAGLRVFALREYRGQADFERQFRNLPSLSEKKCVSGGDKRLHALLVELSECRLDLLRIARFHRYQG